MNTMEPPVDLAPRPGTGSVREFTLDRSGSALGDERDVDIADGGDAADADDGDYDTTLVDLTSDPRFEARIAEIEVARQRRRSRLLVALLATIAIAAVSSIIVRAAVFDVEDVTVQGANRETIDAIVDAAAVEPGTAIWSVDLGAVERRVERLPWVADARVGRSWPDEISITLTEYAATAYVRNADGTVALLGPDGRVLGYDDAAPSGVVEIVGVREVPEPGDTFFPPGVGALMVEIPAALRDRVSTIDVGDGVALQLAPTGRVRLCTATDLDRKGTVALALIRQLPTFSLIDVCVPTAPTSR